MNSVQIFKWFFISIFLVLAYLFFEILKPFLWSLFWAGTLVLILYPIHKRLSLLLRGRVGLSSIIMTVLTTILLVFPLVTIVTVLSVEMFDAYNKLGEFPEDFNIPKMAPIISKIKELLPLSVVEAFEARFDVGDLNPQAILVKGLGSISAFVFVQVQSGAANVAALIFDFGVMVFALFFFFRDGEKYYLDFKHLVPMTVKQKDRVFKNFHDILSAVFIGVLATAGAQGILMGLLFYILGLPYPVIIGAITFVLSILPVAGAVFVWLPVGIILLSQGMVVKGIIMLVVGGAGISSVDNFLKPMIIGGKAKLPTLLLFLTILGGIKLFGFAGIILGPVLLALFLIFLDFYKQEFRED